MTRSFRQELPSNSSYSRYQATALNPKCFSKPSGYFSAFLACSILFFLQSNSWATEPVEKIYINANHMQLNINSGFSTYTGNVKISQGALVLTGDKVTVKQNKDEVEQITVTGKPAHYNHVTEKGEIINAESEHMVYTASKNKLVMTVNAKLMQPDHQVSSQKIVYDTLQKIVIAGEKNIKTDDERVKITLTPKKEPTAE